jgi:starvation-inducible outer membrane lipoprotein
LGADAAPHLQLQVPWEVDNTVCSSDDVTIVDQRSSTAVKQAARAGTCHKQDRRISDTCVEMLSRQADTNADPGLIAALGGCSNRHLHTVTSV